LVGLLLIPTIARTQIATHINISGVVRDDSTSRPIENADVFIANTTLGCGTDQYGRFELKNVPLGANEIAASRVGYKMCSLRLNLSEKGAKEIEIRLRQKSILVGETVVTAPDPSEWRKQLKRFSDLFLGTSDAAKKCKIVNSEVLDFSEADNSFQATALAPLEIDNLALGYHLHFELTLFRVTNESRIADWSSPEGILTYQGLPKFTELQSSSDEEKARWIENRLRVFRGSLRHFLASLYAKELQKNGFSIVSMPNADANAWRAPREAVNEDDITIEGGGPWGRVLHFEGLLLVNYGREGPESDFPRLNIFSGNVQTSWIRLNYRNLSLNSRGLIKEMLPLKAYGYWAWKRVGDLLPLDFEPSAN
jgi:hypothetical protein